MLIEWTTPTQRTDDTALTLGEIAGYRITINNIGNDIDDHVIWIADNTATSYSIDLPNGDYEAYIQAQDTAGTWSPVPTIWTGTVNNTPNIDLLNNLSITRTAVGAGFSFDSNETTAKTVYMAARTSGPYTASADVKNAVGDWTANQAAAATVTGNITGFGLGETVYFGAVQYNGADATSNLLTVEFVTLESATKEITAPESLPFYTVFTGDTSSKTLVVTNGGGTTLNVSNLTAASPFSVVGPTSFAVSAGSSVSVPVEFAPTAPGQHIGTVTIASDDADEPNIVVAVGGNAEPSATAPSKVATTNSATLSCEIGTAGGTLYCAVRSGTQWGPGDEADIIAGTGCVFHDTLTPVVGTNQFTVGQGVLTQGVEYFIAYYQVLPDSVPAIVRYLFADATSGTAIANSADDVGGEALRIEYGSGGAWDDLTVGSGLESATAGQITGGYISYPADLCAALVNKTQLTFTAVLKDISGTTAIPRIFHLGSNALNGQIAMAVGVGVLEVRLNEEAALVADRYRRAHTLPSGTGVHVYQLVMDTTQANEVDRLRLYKDNVLLVRENTLNPTQLCAQNATIDVNPTDHNWGIFNRGSGTRSPIGSIGYFEISDAALDNAQRQAQVDALLANCDGDWQ